MLKGSKSILKKVNYLHIELNQSRYSLGQLVKVLSDNEIEIELIDLRVFEKIDSQVKSADLFLKLKNY